MISPTLECVAKSCYKRTSAMIQWLTGVRNPPVLPWFTNAQLLRQTQTLCSLRSPVSYPIVEVLCTQLRQLWSPPRPLKPQPTSTHTHTHQLPPFLNRGRLDRTVPALTRISIFHLCSDTPSLLWDSVQPPAGTYCTGCGRVARGWRSFWCFSFFSFYFRVFEKKRESFEAECYRGGCFYFVFVCFFFSQTCLCLFSPSELASFWGFFFVRNVFFESHRRGTM